MLLWVKRGLKKSSLSVYTHMLEFFDPTPKSEWKLKDMHDMHFIKHSQELP
jgi:hypothetical protein